MVMATVMVAMTIPFERPSKAKAHLGRTWVYVRDARGWGDSVRLRHGPNLLKTQWQENDVK
jgi:hypothetical protein